MERRVLISKSQQYGMRCCAYLQCQPVEQQYETKSPTDRSGSVPCILQSPSQSYSRCCWWESSGSALDSSTVSSVPGVPRAPIPAHVELRGWNISTVVSSLALRRFLDVRRTPPRAGVLRGATPAVSCRGLAGGSGCGSAWWPSSTSHTGSGTDEKNLRAAAEAAPVGGENVNESSDGTRAFDGATGGPEWLVLLGATG